MMKSHLKLRVTALVASVFVSLAAGTPYLYGVYGPQLMQRCGLTASDSATVSLCTNIGGGLAGFPGGLMIDSIGPQLSILVGSCFIFMGYFGVYKVYEHVVSNLLLICCLMCMMGFGSTLCFFGTLKAAQSNFPNHRGSAGALPVSSYGLSATLFSLIAATFYNDSPGQLIEFLAFFCGSVTFFGSWFVHVYLDEDVKNATEDSESLMTPPTSEEVLLMTRENSSSTLNTLANSNSNNANSSLPLAGTNNLEEATNNKMAPKVIKDSFWGSLSSLGIGNSTPCSSMMVQNTDMNSMQKSPLEVVWFLLSNKIFLLHYCVVSIISGSCQMYIYTIGFIVIAQFNYGKNSTVDPRLNGSSNIVSKSGPVVSDPQAASLQAMQVLIISLSSFSGRLGAGLLSDLIHKKFHLQRLWIVIGTLVTLVIGEYIMMENVQVKLITLTSMLIGFSYGLTFGTYPAVIADKFGSKIFSTSWGLICTGPLISLFILNKFFGFIYDSNVSQDNGICYKGNECYKGAFELAIILAVLILALSFYVIHIQKQYIRPFQT